MPPDPVATPEAPPPGTPLAADPAAGGQETHWGATLPEDLRGDPFVTKYKTVEEAIRGGINANKMIGNSVRFPDANATPEQKAEFDSRVRKHYGIPDKAEGYEISLPDIPGVKFDEGALGNFKQLFLKHGISPAAAQELVVAHGEFTAQQRQATLQSFATGLQDLKKEWGEATFQRRVNLANAAIKEFGGDDAIQLLEDMGLSDRDVCHPMLFKIFAAVGEKMLPDDFVQGRTPGFGDKTKEQLESRLNEIEKDPVYRKGSGDAHTKLVNERIDILQQIYAEPIRK